MKKVFFIFLLFVVPFLSTAQKLSNIRYKKIAFSNTIKLDSLSIAPNSVSVYVNSNKLDSTLYKLDLTKSTIAFNRPLNDSLLIIYRVLPYNLANEMAKYKLDSTQLFNSGLLNPFIFSSYQEPGIITSFSGIDKRGSISRGITFGNSQDVVVNSDLNLQLNGKISDDVSILAAITDKNIPFQADGNTQQLQEFDRIFIKIYSDSLSLLAGDFVLDRPKGYFLNYYKRGQGLSFDAVTSPFKDNKASVLNSNVSAAISKGKFARNQIQGIEANQGPYKLEGNENEPFIIVLSGTEIVYINGKQLTRGQDNDYTINYNTAEITFTPRQLITQNTRIFIEFEYSDKNYTRTMFATTNELKYNKWNVRFNYLTEQDSKNQPLLQDLTESDKLLLSNVGDNINQALIPNVDSVGFNNNEVLYKRVDTLGTQIYIYSTNPNNAFYRVGFASVGSFKGSYIQDVSSANGRVFKFVGFGVGNYEPVRVLVSPKKQQMLTIGADYAINKLTKMNIEYALSGNNINTFSDKDKSDDFGNAIKLNFENKSELRKEWFLKSNLNLEHTDKNFTAFKRFREVEFNRNWNLGNATNQEAVTYTAAKTSFTKSKIGEVSYSVLNLNKVNSYRGFKNNLDGRLTKSGYLLDFKSSVLNSDNIIDTVTSVFYRADADFSKKLSKIILGVNTDFEDNQFNKNNTLQYNSYRFFEWGTYIANTDSAINLYKISYAKRHADSLLLNDTKLTNFAVSDNIAFDYTFKKNPASVLNLNTTYRNINNTHINKREESVLGRVEYNLSLYKGLVKSTTFYQVGSGRELKREYQYILVPNGQGTHTWVDRDSNNIKTLDEFEVGNYPDQRNYLRVFTPTNTYVKVFSNEFNQSLFVRANPKWDKEKGVKKVISKFSLQTNYRLNRKTNNTDVFKSLNPFSNIHDSVLQAINSQQKHTLFFNRSNSNFGVDLTLQNLQSKTLLNNGFEQSKNLFYELNTRNALTKKILLRFNSIVGNKQNKSQFFSTRNFEINYTTFEPKLVYQPSLNFQSSLSYDITTKKNRLDTTGLEQALLNSVKFEVRYNVASQSKFTFNLNYVQINYAANQNTALAYEMLQSLRVGENIVWNLAYVKQLKNNMQVTVNYEGRKSKDVKTIHTGGVQVRAFF